MKRLFLSVGVLAMAGCAGLPTSHVPQKTIGSLCATAGAAMATLALQGTHAQQREALADAAIITPACTAATPTAALTSTVSAAANALIKLAAPYQGAEK